jgi:hypothetical protein
MKKIVRVGQSVADFQGAYVFKWRLLTSPSDVKVCVRDFNFSALHLTSFLRFQNDQVRLKAHTNGTEVWIWISPREPFSWLTVLVEPASQGSIPGIRLKKSVNVFSYTTIGIFETRYRQELPDLTGKLRWKNNQFGFGSSCTLSANPQYAIRDFSCDFTFQNQYLKTRAAWNHTNSGNLVGASIHLRNAEFSAYWENPDFRIAGNFGIGRFWKISFQTFPRQLPRFSVKRKTNFGYINGAMNLNSKHLIGKVKKVTGKFELSAIAIGEKFGLGDWKFAVSLCQMADLNRSSFNRPNPHVPLRI